jgi:hypothetical protein
MAKRKTYALEIIFEGGRGKKRYDNAVEEFDLGPWFVVVTDEVTPTGNLRTVKHRRKFIWAIESEHRGHLGSTKKTKQR